MSTQELQDTLSELQQQHQKAYEDREKARAKEAELAQTQRDLANQMAQTEQKLGDAQAFEELRSREDKQSAVVAARTIAATMPDASRAQRFSDLASELTDKLTSERS